MRRSTAPVVVFIDGSAASLEAALWAVDEAVSRHSWLVLLAVVEPGPEADLSAELMGARRTLRSAQAMVQAARPRAMVKSDVAVGNAASLLLEQSHTAALVCLGQNVALHRDATTSALIRALVRQASSPVAVVRVRHSTSTVPRESWVVAIVHAVPAAESVWSAAVAEARLRDAAVMLLAPRGVSPDSLVAGLADARACSEVEVWAMPWTDDVPGLVAQASEDEQLVVVSAEARTTLQGLFGPESCGASLCSVVVLPSGTSSVESVRLATLGGVELGDFVTSAADAAHSPS